LAGVVQPMTGLNVTYIIKFIMCIMMTLAELINHYLWSTARFHITSHCSFYYT